MITETMIFTKDLADIIDLSNYPDLTEETNTMFCNYVEITRHTNEISSLFDIFVCNLHLIENNFDLYFNDEYSCHSQDNYFYNDLHKQYILINALTGNFISSGVSFLDSIQTLDGKIKDKNIDEEFDMKNRLSHNYDRVFTYRFFYNLRNFFQHGHLPVKIKNDSAKNRLYFDFDALLRTPNFNHKNIIKKEMEKIALDIADKFGDYPHIAYTKSISDYVICIIKTYLNFLLKIEKVVKKLRSKVCDFITLNPNYLFKGSDVFNNYIFFNIQESSDRIELFTLEENPLEKIQADITKVKKMRKTELERSF